MTALLTVTETRLKDPRNMQNKRLYKILYLRREFPPRMPPSFEGCSCPSRCRGQTRCSWRTLSRCCTCWGQVIRQRSLKQRRDYDPNSCMGRQKKNIIIILFIIQFKVVNLRKYISRYIQKLKLIPINVIQAQVILLLSIKPKYSKIFTVKFR